MCLPPRAPRPCGWFLASAFRRGQPWGGPLELHLLLVCIIYVLNNKSTCYSPLILVSWGLLNNIRFCSIKSNVAHFLYDAFSFTFSIPNLAVITNSFCWLPLRRSMIWWALQLTGFIFRLHRKCLSWRNSVAHLQHCLAEIWFRRLQYWRMEIMAG
jgi:hypothetical protein